MSKKDFLKRISYSPTISKIIWKFHLAKTFRQLYFWLNRPLSGIIRVAVAGSESDFYVNTPWELRALESAGDIGHERHILELLLSEIHEGDVVYDIGSNFGIFSIPLAKKVGPNGKVIAVEPEKEIYSHFQRNLKLNNLTNVRSFLLALGDYSGENNLFLGQTAGASSLVSQPAGGKEIQRVKVAKGDSLVKENNLPLPRLIKIDVEGYEYAVIQGFRNILARDDCEIVCCEIHPQLLPKNVKVEHILESFKSLGFNRVDICKRGTTEFHAIAYKGALAKKQKKLKLLVCAFACLKDPDKRFGDGGEGILGWNIVKQLARFHQVSVLSHSQNHDAIEAAFKKKPISNIEFYYLELPKWLNFLQKFSGGVQIYSYFWQIKAYFFVKELHRKLHFDVFHHVTYANDWMASFIGAFLPISYIRGPGGGAHSVPKNFFSEFSSFDRFSQYLRSFGQWLFRHEPFFVISQKKAKMILVCNREAFETIPKRWQQKTRFFPVNGISKEDLDLFSKIEKKNDNKFKILSAGKLLPIKGFSLAVKAFEFFSQQIKNVEFEIIGSGPELPHLKNIAQELKIEDRIKFKNWMSRDEFLRELKSCDVFLFPSLRDGGGQVVIEAMAAGKPVVCLDIAGPGFHIENKWGIKIKPDSPEGAIRGMADALKKIYFDERLRSQLGRLARERVEKEYLWDNLGERLFRIYKEVL